MSAPDLFGDTTGLPITVQSGIPYEIEALSPRETWGAGNGSTTVVCRQKWAKTFDWIRDMVGSVRVAQTGSSSSVLILRRNIPERIGYFEDPRLQFCSGVSQTEQGGDPDETGEDGTNDPPGTFAEVISNWPRTKWCKYQAVFEVFPYRVRTDTEATDINLGAGAYAGARELCRYIIRSRRSYSREQPIPGASTAGGFKIIVDPDTTPTGRKPIGQIGFRVVSMADVTYKWIRVPIAWPPPVGWTGTVPATWPPTTNPAGTDPTTLVYTKQSFIGKINSDYFDCADPQGYCYAPGELLYTGFDDSYVYTDAAGDLVCDVTFMFKFKEGGWNKFLSASGEWKEVSLDGTNAGTKPYATADFNDLFQYS